VNQGLFDSVFEWVKLAALIIFTGMGALVCFSLFQLIFSYCRKSGPTNRNRARNSHTNHSDASVDPAGSVSHTVEGGEERGHAGQNQEKSADSDLNFFFIVCHCVEGAEFDDSGKQHDGCGLADDIALVGRKGHGGSFDSSDGAGIASVAPSVVSIDDYFAGGGVRGAAVSGSAASAAPSSAVGAA